MLAAFFPKQIFSITVIFGKSAKSWKTREQSRFSAEVKVLLSLIRFPSSVISPLSGISKPAIILKSVDFPLPLLPTIEITSPLSHSKLIFFNACTLSLSKDLDIFESVSNLFIQYSPNGNLKK